MDTDAYFEALGWIERGRLDKAQAALVDGLRADPGNLGLRYLQALVDFRQGALEDAEAELDMILSESPDDIAARALRARISREQGDLADAERRFLDLLSENPEDADLLAHYALVMLRAGLVDKSSSLIAEAVRLEPENPFVLSVGAVTHLVASPGRGDDPNLISLVQREPEAQGTLRIVALSLMSQGRLSAARRVTQALVTLGPSDPENIRMAAAARYEAHWSMRPLYPMIRWGWAGSVVIYAVVVGFFFLFNGVIETRIMRGILLVWLAYVVYSWVWPGILKRWKFREISD